MGIQTSQFLEQKEGTFFFFKKGVTIVKKVLLEFSDN